MVQQTWSKGPSLPPFSLKGVDWGDLENFNICSFKELSKVTEDYGVVLAVENV
ncbi:MAG: hypothetical protein QW291_00135 [Thermofilaceae archaeon]